MILAEFEVFHSRPVAPTRRVAISGGRLPVDPAPGFGGLLLAGIVAAHAEFLDDETRDALVAELQQAAGSKVFPISGVTGEGVAALVSAVWQVLQATRSRPDEEDAQT